jgi:hypothetical protein
VLLAAGDLARLAAAEEVDDGDEDDRACERDEEGTDREALVDGAHANQWRDEPAADEGADDADHHVEEDALLLVRVHDEAGEPTDDTANDEPDDEVHMSLLPQAA